MEGLDEIRTHNAKMEGAARMVALSKITPQEQEQILLAKLEMEEDDATVAKVFGKRSVNEIDDDDDD